jgi:hypothetical protein
VSPSNREICIAGALLLVAGIAAAAVAILAEQLGLGAEAARGMFGWRRIALLVAGGVAVVLGAVLAAFPRIAARPAIWERMPVYLGYLAIGLIAVLGIALAWTRLIGLDESFWHDEAFTVLNYSGVGPEAILFGEATFDINNHVAYNLLSWATASVLGTSEAIYRLWSVLPAIVAVGVAAWWAWRRLGAVTAIAFAALAAAAPLHLELAPQARGYGLALLAATLMLIAADRLTREPSRRMLAGFLGAGLLGIWTLFIFAIAFVGQALALVRWPELRRPAIAVVGVAGVLSIAFYAPVLGGVLEARAEGETTPQTISLGAALLLERSLEWLAVPVRRPELESWITLSGLGLIVVAIVALWRRGAGGLALLLVLPVLFFNLVFAIGGLETAERHQFLWMTHLLLLVAVGVGELARIATRYRPLRPLAIATGAVVVIAVTVATLERRQGQVVPFENHKAAASIARQTGLAPIVTDSIRPEGLRYYLGEDLVELLPWDVEPLLCERGQTVVYIRHISLAPEDWGPWAPASLECAAERPSVHISVPQRRNHTSLDIWIVGPRVTPETERARG